MIQMNVFFFVLNSFGFFYLTKYLTDYCVNSVNSIVHTCLYMYKENYCTKNLLNKCIGLLIKQAIYSMYVTFRLTIIVNLS